MRNFAVEENEEKVLKYIDQMVEKNGYPPTVREICKEFDFRSTSTAHSYLSKLKEKGLIKSVPDLSRAIKVETTRYSNSGTLDPNSESMSFTFTLSKDSINLLNQYCQKNETDADEAIKIALQLLK